MADKDTELVKQGEQVLKGRGGKNNFGTSNKALVRTDEDRELVKQLLRETVVAYRQPKVNSDEELAERLNDYFNGCAATGQVPTVEEMCLSTGYAQATIWDWETGRRQGFTSATADIIKKAKDFMQTFDAKMVVTGKLNFLAYCFRAKNYYGMQDKSEVVLTPNTQQSDDPATLVQAAKMLPESGGAE